MNEIVKSSEYQKFIVSLKSEVQTAQIKASLSVNCKMLQLYWFIGSEIAEKQKTATWGNGLVKQVSDDLQKEFPNIKGFSVSNIKYMKQWILFWYPILISQQVVDQLEDNPIFQIPWGQNLVILSKCKSSKKALFYVQKTIINNWSRAVLTHQIESGLFEKEGKAITNFENHLPAPHSDLANQILKNPYTFDFLTMREKYDEKELENALVANITDFLLELGAGFSYVGKQQKITVDGDDFYMDLLFYHIKLHSYVVIELKTGKFRPEYAGKLNFYVSAVDDILAGNGDNPTIGIIICKSKKKTVVEYSLKDVSKPIGISEYELTKFLPEKFISSLPTVEQIEAEIGEVLL